MMIDTDGLLELLILAAFLIFLLPPLVATVTGIVCVNAMPGLPRVWGPLAGLGLGIVGIAVNIAGLLLLLILVNVEPADWAQEIFCEKPLHLINNRHNSFCYPAMRWAPRVFWIGISLITPAAAAVGTWWLCRRRSVAQRGPVAAHD